MVFRESLVVLGSTGSIGTNALKVVEKLSDIFVKFSILLKDMAYFGNN